MGELEWRRYIRRSDGECPPCTLKNDVRYELPDEEMTPKARLVGDHVANGEGEVCRCCGISHQNVITKKNGEAESSQGSQETTCPDRSNSRVVAATRCKLPNEISHRRRRQDGRAEKDREAMVQTSARVRGTKSLEASSRPRAAIWTSASNERGALCGTSLQDRKRPCDDERRHRERTRNQPSVAGRTLGHS